MRLLVSAPSRESAVLQVRRDPSGPFRGGCGDFANAEFLHHNHGPIAITPTQQQRRDALIAKRLACVLLADERTELLSLLQVRTLFRSLSNLSVSSVQHFALLLILSHLTLAHAEHRAEVGAALPPRALPHQPMRTSRCRRSRSAGADPHPLPQEPLRRDTVPAHSAEPDWNPQRGLEPAPFRLEPQWQPRRTRYVSFSDPRAVHQLL